MCSSDLTLAVSTYADLTGNFSFDQNAGNLRGIGSGITAQMAVGSSSVGLTSASLGLIATPSDTLALESQGVFSLSAAGISNISADSARLRYNNTNQAWSGSSLSIGDQTWTFTNLPQSDSLKVLSASNMVARLADSVTLSGNAGFQLTGSELQAVVTNGSALLNAGSVNAGVSAATAALVIDGSGNRQLYAAGNFSVSATGVTEVSGTATARQNTATSATTAKSITVEIGRAHV